MEKHQQETPIDIALALENLATFITTAGFTEAASLIMMAALSAADQIHRAPIPRASAANGSRRDAAVTTASVRPMGPPAQPS
jgi:hypothetical protein